MGTVFIFSGTEHTPEQVEALKAAGEYAAYLKSDEAVAIIRHHGYEAGT